jgi:hypothetical protein
MNIFDLGFTPAYRKLQRKLSSLLKSRQDAVAERMKARGAAQRQAANLELLADDARFHGVPLEELLPSDDEMFEKDVYGDWPEGL